MTGGNDTCTVTFSAAVQTQILGASGGGHIRDLNCERLKNSKTLYNMGMKVAAVALMCQDASVFKAMEMAGTPCPFNGTIGNEAQQLWDENVEMQPETIEQELRRNDKLEGAALGAGSILLLLLLL
jgi:poly(3-hydroxybutyrate) depolymerase